MLETFYILLLENQNMHLYHASQRRSDITIRLAYETSVVLLKYPDMSDIMHGMASQVFQ